MPTTYKTWLAEINTLVTKKLGLGIDDLPDHLYAEYYEDGLTPQEVCDEICEEYDEKVLGI